MYTLRNSAAISIHGVSFARRVGASDGSWRNGKTTCSWLGAAGGGMYIGVPGRRERQEGRGKLFLQLRAGKGRLRVTPYGILDVFVVRLTRKYIGKCR